MNSHNNHKINQIAIYYHQKNRNFTHLSAIHGVSQNVNFLLINGIQNAHYAPDFVLISFPEICINSGPRFHNLLVKESLIFSHAKGDLFPSVFEVGFRKELTNS